MPAKKKQLPHKTPKTPPPPPTAAEKFQPPEFTKKPVNPDVIIQPPYYDLCTAKMYEVQDGNFYTTPSELFAGNTTFYPISKASLDKYYIHLLYKLDHNQEMALDRIAQLMDLYVNDELIATAISASEKKSPVGILVRYCNMVQYRGKTYMDTMIERFEAQEKERKRNAGEVVDTDKRAIELFGFGYKPDEYAILLQHYEMLTKQFSNADGVQDAMIKDLCDIKVMQMNAKSSGDADGYSKLTKLYQDTLKNSGLKLRSDDTAFSNDENACFGVWRGMIEQHCPAEIYQDTKLFEDVDSVKDYFRRFILRPVINFFSGRNEMDPEYNLTEEEMKDGNA